MTTARRHCWSKKSAISTGNEARSVAGSSVGGPGGCRLLPPGPGLRVSAIRLPSSDKSSKQLWGLSTASYLRLEAAPHPHHGVVSIAAGQEEPPITTLWPCVSSRLQSAQSRHSGSPRSIRRRKLFPTSPPPPLVGSGSCKADSRRAPQPQTCGGSVVARACLSGPRHLPRSHHGIVR